MDPFTRRGMVERMRAAAMLEVSVYEEVEADTDATFQAGAVVAIVALASAVANIGDGATGAFTALMSALVAWLLWAGITYLIGDKLLGGTASWGELLRTLGFAQSPGVLLVLGIIPIIGWLVSAVVGIWVLVASIIAIRQALDFGTGKAILTAVLGWIPYVALAALLVRA